MSFFSDTVTPALIDSATSIAGGIMSAHNSRDLWRLNYNAQKEFAQNSVRWRVADAQAAGVHPIYALGASGASFSPMQGYTGDYGLSEAGHAFSQGIQRASEAKMTREERERQEQRQVAQDALQLKQLDAQNRYTDAQIDLLKAETTRANIQSQLALKNQSTQRPPAMPSMTDKNKTAVEGQGDSFLDKPINQYGFERDYKGRLQGFVPSDDMSQRTEDKLIIEWLPWLGAFAKNIRGKMLGEEVDGYWWHGEDKGYLPYPPKKAKSKPKSRRYYSRIDESSLPYYP